MPQTTIPTLHNLAHSQSLRISWALEEIRLANPSFQFHQKNYPRTVTNSELKKIHPLGKSPVVTLETTDGSLPPTVQLQPGILSESKLILDFISAEYADGLFTPSAEDKNRDIFFTMFASGSLTLKADFCVIFEAPAQMAPFPFNLPFKLTGYPMVSRFLDDLQGIYQIMEEALSEEKPFFSGAKLGVADLNASFGMDMAEQRGGLGNGFRGGDSEVGGWEFDLWLLGLYWDGCSEMVGLVYKMEVLTHCSGCLGDQELSG
ncbi:hypothetical protein CC80DRAFT_184153 [Byssothecium circinans]|uniref:GST N-terminal domain-containing protein n=1 Tax=Byssothecium circinans TaxID=147558 RepID=A0A6A5TMD3_9PLEO|nr:hypothetical protein CC80DRAFT_184153 [Byssothecium circinans]